MVPFCRQMWKIPTIGLLLACLATFAWTFRVWDDLDELSIEDYSQDRMDRSGENRLALSPAMLGPTLIIPPGAQTPNPALPGSALVQTLRPASPAQAKTVALGIPQPTPVANSIQELPLVMLIRDKSGVVLPIGLGTIVHPKGYVITLQHQVAQLSNLMALVQTPNGPKQYPVEVVKTVPEHNLVLLKIVSKDMFPYLVLGDSTRLMPGDPVLALGKTGSNGLLSIPGRIQALDQQLQIQNTVLANLIRTEAIAHVNQSGGVLLDQNNRLLGINLPIQTPTGQVLGYAIPSHVIQAHFQDLVQFPQSFLSTTPQVAMFDPNFRGVAQNTPVRTGSGNGAGSGAGLVNPGRDPRPADQWWQKAVTEHAPKLQPSRPTGAVAMNVALPARNAVPNLTTTHPVGKTLWGYPLQTIAMLVLLGLLSGISGGMMTMGGGIIKVTGLMLLFGYGLVLVRPVAYVTNIFVYGAATLRYQRDGLLRWENVKHLVPWAVVGMVIGYFVGNYMGNKIIQYLLGVFALFVGIKMLVEILEQKREAEGWDEEHPSKEKSHQEITELFLRYLGVKEIPQEYQPKFANPWARNGLLGFPLGLISGILGITGGVVEVPLQRYVAGVPLRNAIANSAVLVFWASLVGSVVSLLHGSQIGVFEWQTPIVLSLFLIPGAYLGGWIGARLTKIVPLNVLRWLYAFLMFAIAIKMFLI